MRQRTILLISSGDCGWTDLRLALGTMAEVRVVGDVRGARQAIQLATTLRPDVVIAAARVEEASALPLLRELYQDLPTSKIIVLATSFDPADLMALDEISITGHLLWSDLSSETLRHCLAAMIASDIIVASPALAAQRGPAPSRTASVPLSKRQRAILGRLAEGLTHHQIAQVEPLSLRTVERVVADLQQKFDAPNQFVLAKKATQLGLIR